LKNTRILLPLLIFVVAVAVHLRAVNYGFVSDEKLLITQNRTVRDLRLGEMLTGKFWPGEYRGVYYRPAVTLSYGLGHAMAGEAFWFHHLGNFVFHGLAALGVYFLLLRLFKNPTVAFMASIVFAVHPVHTESVVWIPGRTDVMAAAFGLFAWLALLKARGPQETALRASWFFTSLLLFILALGSKEVALVFPALVLAADYFGKIQDSSPWQSMKKRLPEYAVMGAVAVLYLVARTSILSGEGPGPAADPLAAFTIFHRVLAIITVFAASFLKMLWPHPWLPDFAYEDAFVNMPMAFMLVAAAFVVVLLGLAFEYRKTKPLYSFSIVATLLSILPSSHVVPFPTVFAERFLYLPSVFFSALAGLVLYDLLQAASFKKRAIVIIGLFVITLSILSAGRASSFKNGIVFWKNVVNEAPDLHIAHKWLADFHQEEDNHRKALQHYEWALNLDPDFTPARLNQVYSLIMSGRPEQAEERLDKLSAKEDLQTKTVESVADLYNELGLAYSRRYKWSSAKRQWERALELSPENAESHILLARLYLTVLDEKEKGGSHLRKARQLAPDHPLLQKLKSGMQRY